MLDRLLALETSGIKLGLDNISRLCAALGHPERTFTTLHVAGTNGKGSVTAMVHAALVAAGVRAGRYISPHLVDLSERFVIGSGPIDTEALRRAAEHVLDCADALKAAGSLPIHPTFFEATTAIAFELFRRARVDVAVIEVGLGGRYDSTNVIAPAAGAITSIGFDHQQWLGETIEAIAFEKAGIVKSGMDLVIGILPDEARRVVCDVAAGQQARVIDAAHGARVTRDARGDRDELIIETPDDRYGPLSLALRGEHQVGNALVAIRLLEAARHRGIRVSRDAIERGLIEVDWPGRLELIRLPGGGQVLLDAAHNVDGARALAAYLRRRHPERPALVVGMMRDKDVEGIMGALLPVASAVVATAAATARAIPARELAARIAATGPSVPLRAEPDPPRAVEQALSSSRTVCVAGSIFVVGAVRDGLRRRAILR
ncbi:MAG: bifunctional folylpolyglutamate synthase/dihydrofolate synthase [Acidobacteria bacterium]|nr:bifunctional folylpolyglutamate synthase/dihydrofolate synthase [Acidobacteriota bacterium]